ncbi:MAG: hypothetical protein A2381_12510 [Bdellovibrionales bacterium RIFOXYB1_FULL_37_110]|nr:MAG: hypothetical protein A2181_07235 [Bdellovibrionales bacterium RIFOXYA1_FULL_38_20]OFZ51507.1 MAG: hypothetical protein A2417_12195 [Bdellovibrionales bacterium RIFOXYC1_FULL_37_79]OFZ60341.1 MAG: hypothetical protein A2381_12510 [Bdellovibrionales bacterium RIFOXYB1_FULL_37_110]OFZ63831.1 MAG: hypothetical protein A2577_05425 [Bdellovibrionales bacterium RIFOXYD1_FULL_36_51]
MSQNTPIPNQATEKKTVLIGMNGSMDSTVTAYLLTKQEYKCMGLGVLFADEAKNDKKLDQNLFGICNLFDLEQTKQICQELSMPFYAVNAREIYKSEVIDYVINGRLQGRKFSNCIRCSNLLMGILLEKANLLGADFFATGHYAKVAYNKDSNEYSLHASSDLLDDQSYLLSTLSTKHLSKLILPLGDMRKQEVIKISKLLKYKFKDTRKKTFCFEQDQIVVELVEKNSTEEFWFKGDIVAFENKDVLGEHQGLYKYKHGQVKFAAGDDSSLKNHKVVMLDASSRKIFVDKEKNFKVDYCEIAKFTPINVLDISRPFKAYVQWSMTHEKVACTLYFKSFDHVLIKFQKIQEGPLAVGGIISIYNKNSRNAQLLGCGECIEAGIYSVIERLEGQLDEDTLVEIEEDRKGRNIDEYKF